MFIYEKKNSTCRDKTTPGIVVIEEDILTQTEKTPEPLPHPDTGAPLPCDNREGPFDLCFGMGQTRGFF